MARVLIAVPDPDRPGVVRLIEQSPFYIGLAPAGGVLEVRQDEDAEIVYYAPGAWHSFTRGNAASLIQQTSIPVDVPDVESDTATTAGG